MKYKGYGAYIQYDESIEAFHGRIVGIEDVITFEGKSVSALKKAFREAVDDYLQWCEEEGRQPNKPCHGRFMLRMQPELHREIMIAAEAQGKSMNQYIVEVLDVVKEG
ncbi:MAG: type II toxin-antitoxin system HicB family antitoxin [Candidatus Hydrogenedentota bacterium]